jgi:hypothetical protein
MCSRLMVEQPMLIKIKIFQPTVEFSRFLTSDKILFIYFIMDCLLLLVSIIYSYFSVFLMCIICKIFRTNKRLTDCFVLIYTSIKEN